MRLEVPEVARDEDAGMLQCDGGDAQIRLADLRLQTFKSS